MYLVLCRGMLITHSEWIQDWKHRAKEEPQGNCSYKLGIGIRQIKRKWGVVKVELILDLDAATQPVRTSLI